MVPHCVIGVGKITHVVSSNPGLPEFRAFISLENSKAKICSPFTRAACNYIAELNEFSTGRDGMAKENSDGTTI